MPILDHFALIAPLYDRLFPLKDERQLVQVAALPVTGWLLDAAGGTGRVAWGLRRYAGCVIVADESVGTLHQAERKRGLNPVCTHTERLPFPDQSFERIIMVDALHHVASQAQTTSELWRLLSRGGRIVIEEFDIRTLPVKLVALVEKLLFMRSHFLSPPQIQALFPYPEARVWIERAGHKSWIIVEKS